MARTLALQQVKPHSQRGSGLAREEQKIRKQDKSHHLTTEHQGASLVAQLAKNPLAMQETLVRPLGWDDPLQKGKATHSSILAWNSK